MFLFPVKNKSTFLYCGSSLPILLGFFYITGGICLIIAAIFLMSFLAELIGLLVKKKIPGKFFRFSGFFSAFWVIYLLLLLLLNLTVFKGDSELTSYLYPIYFTLLGLEGILFFWLLKRKIVFKNRIIKIVFLLLFLFLIVAGAVLTTLNYFSYSDTIKFHLKLSSLSHSCNSEKILLKTVITEQLKDSNNQTGILAGILAGTPWDYAFSVQDETDFKTACDEEKKQGRKCNEDCMDYFIYTAPGNQPLGCGGPDRIY